MTCKKAHKKLAEAIWQKKKDAQVTRQVLNISNISFQKSKIKIKKERKNIFKNAPFRRKKMHLKTKIKFFIKIFLSLVGKE